MGFMRMLNFLEVHLDDNYLNEFTKQSRQITSGLMCYPSTYQSIKKILSLREYDIDLVSWFSLFTHLSLHKGLFHLIRDKATVHLQTWRCLIQQFNQQGSNDRPSPPAPSTNQIKQDLQVNEPVIPSLGGWMWDSQIVDKS